jgi:DNA-binding MarR family transcriptional regulator
MKGVTDRLTAAEGQSTPRLSVLSEIARRGPLTVAQIAKARQVARQGVQRLADELAKNGLVGCVKHPAHRRSPLLPLTPAGRRLTARLLYWRLLLAGARWRAAHSRGRLRANVVGHTLLPAWARSRSATTLGGPPGLGLDNHPWSRRLKSSRPSLSS